MIDAIDRRTRVMTVASVTFAPGHRADLARAAKACRAKDVFLLVKATAKRSGKTRTRSLTTTSPRSVGWKRF